MLNNIVVYGFSRLIALSVLLISPTLAIATTWNVQGNAGTIQGGIDLASAGDTVLVDPGVYSGAGNVNLTFGGVDLVLLSSAGREQTAIDCQFSARGLSFTSGESTSAVVDGFTIRNGTATTGGGLLVDEASPLIRNCRFVHCFASSHGGAADLQDVSSPQFESCVFDSNSTSGNYHTGGAIRLFDDASFYDCTFRDNEAGGIGGAIRLLDAGDISFELRTFEGNKAIDGGAVANQSAVTMTYNSCRFAGNYASNSGGGDLDLLEPATPNPFGPTTRLTYTVPAGRHENVYLKVYDVWGRLVRELADGPHAAGRYTVSWDGNNQAG